MSALTHSGSFQKLNGAVMDASAELLGKLDDYIGRRISLWELESWLAPRLFCYLNAPDSLAGRIAGAVELCLAEISAGIRSERSVRQSLARYKAKQEIRWLSYPEEEQTITTGSVIDQFIPVVGLLNPMQVWNTEPAEVSS